MWDIYIHISTNLSYTSTRKNNDKTTINNNNNTDNGNNNNLKKRQLGFATVAQVHDDDDRETMCTFILTKHDQLLLVRAAIPPSQGHDHLEAMTYKQLASDPARAGS